MTGWGWESDERGKVIYYNKKYRLIPRNKLTYVYPVRSLSNFSGWLEGGEN